MTDFANSMIEYHNQLQKGAIQKAYRGLMDYMQALKAHFAKAYPQYALPGSLYFGYMDMTYFAIIPPSLKPRGLKIALVFAHEPFRFEVWLSGVNRDIQVHTWQALKDSGWNAYPLVADPRKTDAVVEHVIVENPDFSDLPGLTTLIEHETLAFIKDIEHSLNVR